jgi:hypothetical protein
MMQAISTVDAAPDDLLEVLAEIVMQLVSGHDQLEARDTTQRETRRAGRRAQERRKV